MSIRTVDERPNLTRLFGQAVVTARSRHGDRLPGITIEQPGVRINRENLANYADVCGFRQSDVLPPTYPHLLGFPLAVTLMVDQGFPFALPGLIHVSNRIEQQRSLRADEDFTVTVRASHLRDHPRGRQFDMITELRHDGEIVWSESSTYLHRESRPTEKPSPSGAESSGGASPAAIWRIPGNIGRRYARVSGDVNPIHLNPLAARLFGFPRTIAHGMWVKARAVAALEGRLPDWLTAEVEFKSPVLLPSTVGFRVVQDTDEWRVELAQMGRGRLHLNGRLGAGRT